MRERCWVLCIVYLRGSNETFKRIIPRLVTPWNNLPTCLLHGIRPLSLLLYCLWFQLWRRGYLCHMSLRRKIYWTDGNTINMASMDGSNSKVLHQNQRDPVGQYERSGPHADGELLVRCVSVAARSTLDAVLRWSLPKRTFVFICVVATFWSSWWSHLDANALFYWRSWVGSGVHFRAREGQLYTGPWSLYLLMHDVFQ